MVDLEDEQIVIASTLIALETRPSLKVGQLSDYVCEMSRNIGMKRFRNISNTSFTRVIIPLSIPVLKRAALIEVYNKTATSLHEEAHETGPDTICRLTEKTLKSMKNIRNGSRIKSGSPEQREIFDNVFTIVNGHTDDNSEQDAFDRHMKIGLHIPAV